MTGVTLSAEVLVIARSSVRNKLTFTCCGIAGVVGAQILVVADKGCSGHALACSQVNGLLPVTEITVIAVSGIGCVLTPFGRVTDIRGPRFAIITVYGLTGRALAGLTGLGAVTGIRITAT